MMELFFCRSSLLLAHSLDLLIQSRVHTIDLVRISRPVALILLDCFFVFGLLCVCGHCFGKKSTKHSCPFFPCASHNRECMTVMGEGTQKGQPPCVNGNVKWTNTITCVRWGSNLKKNRNAVPPSSHHGWVRARHHLNKIAPSMQRDAVLHGTKEFPLI